jgi:hypothetical protein
VFVETTSLHPHEMKTAVAKTSQAEEKPPKPHR